MLFPIPMKGITKHYYSHKNVCSIIIQTGMSVFIKPLAPCAGMSMHTSLTCCYALFCVNEQFMSWNDGVSHFPHGQSLPIPLEPNIKPFQA